MSQNQRPLNSHQKSLLAMPPIARQMPVKFGNKASWAELEGYCIDCGQPIKDELLRGRVTRPTEHVAVVEAVGVCVPCKRVTEFHYRLHDDMRMTGKDRDGRWVTWRHRKSWLDWLVGLIGGLGRA